MMATVTTTTTTAVAATMTLQQGIALGAIATGILVALLALKELLNAYASSEHVRGTWKADAVRFYATTLNVAILPMGVIFGMIVVTKLAALL